MKQRLLALDAIKGLAILMVVMGLSSSSGRNIDCSRSNPKTEMR